MSWTDVAAIYGAGVATAAAILGGYMWWKDRRDDVRVTKFTALRTGSGELRGLFLRVVNLSRHPVRIARVLVFPSNRRKDVSWAQVYDSMWVQPHDGTACQVVIPIDRRRGKIVAEVELGSGTRVRTDVLDLDEVQGATQGDT